MEYNEFQIDLDKLSPQRAKQLLITADAWAVGILNDHHLIEDPNRATVPATTTELFGRNASGELRMIATGGGYQFDYVVQDSGSNQENTIERFVLEQTGDDNDYYLLTSGALPYVHHLGSDDTQGITALNIEMFYNSALRTADPKDISKLMDILDAALCGSQQVNIDSLENEIYYYLKQM